MELFFKASLIRNSSINHTLCKDGPFQISISHRYAALSALKISHVYNYLVLLLWVAYDAKTQRQQTGGSGQRASRAHERGLCNARARAECERGSAPSTAGPRATRYLRHGPAQWESAAQPYQHDPRAIRLRRFLQRPLGDYLGTYDHRRHRSERLHAILSSVLYDLDAVQNPFWRRY